MEVMITLSHLSANDIEKLNLLYDSLISKEGVNGQITITRYGDANNHK